MNTFYKNSLILVDSKISKLKENIQGIRLELTKGLNVFHPKDFTEYRKHIYDMEEEIFDLENKREMLIKVLGDDAK